MQEKFSGLSIVQEAKLQTSHTLWCSRSQYVIFKCEKHKAVCAILFTRCSLIPIIRTSKVNSVIKSLTHRLHRTQSFCQSRQRKKSQFHRTFKNVLEVWEKGYYLGFVIFCYAVLFDLLHTIFYRLHNITQSQTQNTCTNKYKKRMKHSKLDFKGHSVSK